MLEDVGSKKMVLGGSWGHVVTFWWQASASNLSWVHLGWELGGWLGGLGAQGEPRTGGNPQRWYPALLGGLGAVARGSFKDFISSDFRALRL